MYGSELLQITIPIWVELVWLRPVQRVLMEQHNGHFNNSSFRDSYSIDGSSLIAFSLKPAEECKISVIAMIYNNVAAPNSYLTPGE